MLDRVVLKIREIFYRLFHFRILNEVTLHGVPRILYGNRIKFGKNVRLNEDVFLHAVAGIEIGENTTLSTGVQVITETYDLSSYKNYVKRQHNGKKIIIGKNVWIGANAIILPGVNIRDNIVVGAGSVVTKDLTDEYTVYAGNPAKIINKVEH